jgi:hypothetical protein
MMSDEYAKLKHSKRIFTKKVSSKKQSNIAKAYGVIVDHVHKYVKRKWANCGNSDCVMCGNPRKFFGEKTMQEKKLEQRGNDD